MAAAVQENARRAGARATVTQEERSEDDRDRKARLEASVDRHHALDEEGRGAGVVGEVEGRKRGGGRTSGAGRHSDRFDARPLVDVVAHPHQPAARARGTAAETADAAAGSEPLVRRYSGADRGVSRDAPKTAESSYAGVTSS